MNADIAVCRKCGSLYVVTTVHDRPEPVFSFLCCECGERTPPREDRSTAAQDVDWVPVQEAGLRGDTAFAL